MATNPAVAAEVEAHFVRRGLPVGLAEAGRDLGLDVSMGGARRLATRTSRLKKASGRLCRSGVAASSVGTMAAKISIGGALEQHQPRLLGSGAECARLWVFILVVGVPPVVSRYLALGRRTFSTACPWKR